MWSTLLYSCHTLLGPPEVSHLGAQVSIQMTIKYAENLFNSHDTSFFTDILYIKYYKHEHTVFQLISWLFVCTTIETLHRVVHQDGKINRHLQETCGDYVVKQLYFPNIYNSSRVAKPLLCRKDSLAITIAVHSLCFYSHNFTVIWRSPSFRGKLYWYSSVGTTELVLYREVECTVSLILRVI